MRTAAVWSCFRNRCRPTQTAAAFADSAILHRSKPSNCFSEKNFCFPRNRRPAFPVYMGEGASKEAGKERLMEDEKIVELYWQRSSEAIAETSRKYGAYCMRISMNILANREDSEENVSDTYLRVWNSVRRSARIFWQRFSDALPAIWRSTAARRQMPKSAAGAKPSFPLRSWRNVCLPAASRKAKRSRQPFLVSSAIFCEPRARTSGRCFFSGILNAVRSHRSPVTSDFPKARSNPC